MLTRFWLLFMLLISQIGNLAKAQGGNTCAAASAVSLNVPFNLNNINLCGTGNDYNGANACITGGWGNTYGGQDWLYAFTPSQSGLISITLDDIQSSGPAFPTLSLYQDCPGIPGACLATVQGSSWNNAGATLVYSVQAGMQYFIGIDAFTISNFYANCYRYDLEASLTPTTIEASCSNMGFDDGNLGSWFATTGSAVTASPGSPTPNYNISGIGIVNGRHTIMNGGNDPCAGFPRVDPQGSPFSVRLGNNNTGANAEQLKQTFMVSENNSSFTYRYAVVFEDPGHGSSEQPFFKALLRDENGDVIPCSEFIVSAAANLPGFFNSNTCAGVRYKPWSTVNVDLSNYLGQAVTVEFTAGDCSQGGHFGYAYIDAACAPSTLAALADTICPGESVTLTAPDGYASYQWLPGNSTTQSITVSPLVSTVYTLNLTAFNGCSSVFQIPITVAPTPTPAINFVAPACDLPVQVQATASNISNLSWQFGSVGQPSTSTQPTVNVLFPGPGIYPVTLNVVSAEGCSGSSTQNIVVPPCVFRIAITGDTICAGECLDFPVSMAYGVPPYSYSWSTGSSNNIIQVCTSQSQIISLTVTDADGAIATDTALIAVAPDILFQGTVSNLSCFESNNGNITTNLQGWGPFTYGWSQGGNTNAISGLSAGSYSLSVTDAFGCPADTTFIITQPPAIEFQYTSQPATCNLNNASIIVEEVFGGTAPYNYALSGFGSGTSTVFNQLAPGNYLLLVSDANGCMDSLNASVGQLSVPESILFQIEDATCLQSNGSIVINQINGGFAPYSLSLDNAAAVQIDLPFNIESLAEGLHHVMISDSLGCIIDTLTTIGQHPGPSQLTFSTSPETCYLSNGALILDSISGGTPSFVITMNGVEIDIGITGGLDPGSYPLSVSDANNCLLDTIVTIAFIPPVQIESILLQNPTCYGLGNGSATASIIQGSAPYSFSWSNGANDSLASSLHAGLYTVSVTDSNGCTDIDTVVLVQPEPLTMEVSYHPPLCGESNGVITADNVSGGTMPYLLSLNGQNWLTDQIFDGLNDGQYQLFVQDSNLCLDSVQITLTTPSYPLAILATGNDAVCNENNGRIVLSSVIGGSWPLQLSFNNGEWAEINTFPLSFDALAEGSYTLIIRDTNNCETDTAIVLTRQEGPSEIEFVTTDATCSQFNSVIEVTNVVSGTQPFNFTLNGNQTQQGLFEGLAPGIYIFEVVDANGCTLDTSAQTLAIPDVLMELFQTDPVSCIGYSDAALFADVISGTAPFSIVWSNGTSGVLNDSLGAGAYSAVVIDAMGCSDTVSYSISDPEPLVIDVTGPEYVCEGHEIELHAIASGGTGHLTIYWPELGVLAETINHLPAQSALYHASVTDDYGCHGIDSTFVMLRLNPTGQIVPDITEGCAPVCVNLSWIPSDSANISQYSWNFSGQGVSMSANPAVCFESAGGQSISLNLTDEYGCQAAFEEENLVHVFPVPVARFSFNPNQPDIIHPLVRFFDESEHAVTWNWTFSDGGISFEQNPERIFPDTGSYSACLKVSSAQGCEDFICKNLEIDPSPALFVPTAFTPNGDGTNDVFVVKMMYIEKYLLEIFDRWGELLYETTDQEAGWDGIYMGRLCQEDVYVWRVTYTDVQRKSEQLIGRVTLIE